MNLSPSYAYVHAQLKNSKPREIQALADKIGCHYRTLYRLKLAQIKRPNGQLLDAVEAYYRQARC